MPTTPSAGLRLGPYELIVRIGQGGMGEVWRARDTRLNREVAIKTSAQQFTDRFDKEAHAIAALNHPNICTLFDVGPDYLVMELIDGPTLQDRIKDGPIPLDEALAIARQIADALEAAHERNIVHRDLKPGNIKLGANGSVKVLDFGLAKTSLPQAQVTSDSPTLLHAPTQAGIILGTAAYMAPEQARGKVVDKRADIWSFGVVLYEMLTGRRPFEGADLTEILATVVKSDPDLTPIPRKARRLIEACLQKDPATRLRDIADAWKLLDSEIITEPRPSGSGFAWAVAGAMTLALAALAFLHFRESPPPQPNAIQFTLDPPAGNSYTNTHGATAVSPDGRYLIFGAATVGGAEQLWIRPVGSPDSRALPGTTGGNFPFWSPDSKSIAFFADSELKRIDIAGGSPTILCDGVGDANTTAAGGTWSSDGVILFAGSDGLHRIAASGGPASLLTKTDASRKEILHSLPQFLPGGKSFIYFIASSDPGVQGVYAGMLDRPQEKTRIVATDRKAIYSAPLNGRAGSLLWLQNQSLVAQDFDPGSFRLSGAAVPIADISAAPGAAGGRAPFWASDAGLLVYRSGDSFVKSKLVWIGRDGKELEDATPEDTHGSLSLSTDGKRVAYGLYNAARKSDIWIYDLVRKASTRLTFGPDERDPVWSPDGRFIAFDSDRSGLRQIYRREADGSGQEEQLTSGPEAKQITDWTRDGNYIIYTAVGSKTGQDLWALPMNPDPSGKRDPVALAQTRFFERAGVVSPDGKWLAYESNESGIFQIYVRAFPSGSGKWQISTDGGDHPEWSPDGKEVFYGLPAGGNTRMMAAAVRRGASGFEADAPHELFSVPAVRGADVRFFGVAPEGKRLLIPRRDPAAAPPSLTVVQNWQAALKK